MLYSFSKYGNSSIFCHLFYILFPQVPDAAPALVRNLASAASASMSLPNHISGAAVPCSAAAAAAVMRDKKTGGNDSTAVDNNLNDNDKAAKGCVNQAEGDNVSFNRPNSKALMIKCKVSFIIQYAIRFRTFP